MSETMAYPQIEVDEILTVFTWFIAALKEKGVVAIGSYEYDYYLEVPFEEKIRLEQEAVSFGVGSLADDIGFLRSDIRAGELSSTYNCIHLLELINSAVNGKNLVFKEEVE